MSTDTGRMMVEKARSYSSPPEQLSEMQRIGGAIIVELDEQGLLEAATASEMKSLANDAAGGLDPILSAQAFRQTNSNFFVWCGRAALGLILGDGLLQSQVGIGGVQLSQHLIDRITFFLVEQTPVLLQLAAISAADLQWLPNVLRVVKLKRLDTVVANAVGDIISR